MRSEELRYAVRPGVVVRFVGQLCVVLALLTVPPLLAGLWFVDFRFALRTAAVVGLLLAFGLPAARRRGPESVQVNEALVIVGLIFLVAPLAMVYPMTSAGLSFVDALFETVSGVTTTGLTTLATIEGLPRAFLFTRAWMQWYGGLGFVVLSVALLMRPGAAARRLTNWPGEEEDLLGSTRAHARVVLVVYAALTVIGFVLLAATGIGLFDALVHVLAAVSTGGFSSRDASLAGLGGPAVQLLVLLVCLSAAVPLVLYHRAARHGVAEMTADVQARGLLALCLLQAVVLVLVLRHVEGWAWREALHHGPLQALSAQTTAGFSTTGMGSLGAAARLVLIVSMFVGGAVGSTAGGIKVLRLLISIRLLGELIRRTSLSEHAVFEPHLGGRRLEPNEGQATLLLILLFVAAVATSWLAFLAGGHDPLDSLFEVVSAIGTVGLSTGVAGPELATSLKAVLCIDMLLGRLEMVAFVVMLSPATWIGRRRSEGR